MPTYLRFGDDHSVAIQEPYEEVKRRIAATASQAVPMFEVTRVDGARLFVNANELWTVSEGRQGRPEKT
jgi:hypothetical protein